MVFGIFKKRDQEGVSLNADDKFTGWHIPYIELSKREFIDPIVEKRDIARTLRKYGFLVVSEYIENPGENTVYAFYSSNKVDDFGNDWIVLRIRHAKKFLKGQYLQKINRIQEARIIAEYNARSMSKRVLQDDPDVDYTLIPSNLLSNLGIEQGSLPAFLRRFHFESIIDFAYSRCESRQMKYMEHYIHELVDKKIKLDKEYDALNISHIHERLASIDYDELHPDYSTIIAEKEATYAVLRKTEEVYIRLIYRLAHYVKTEQFEAYNENMRYMAGATYKSSFDETFNEFDETFNELYGK